MPRVILRTTEPAKLLACQSVEKRWTRWKASCAISPIIRSVSGMMPLQPRWRRTTMPAPSPTMAPKAAKAAYFAASRSVDTSVSASTSFPAKNGMKTSASVAVTMAKATPATRAGWRRQWRNVKARTVRIASARRVRRRVDLTTVMNLIGAPVRRLQYGSRGTAP